MRLTTRTLNKNWSLASGVTTIKSERKTFTSVSIEISLIWSHACWAMNHNKH